MIDVSTLQRGLIEACAKAGYASNRAICEYVGDTSYPNPWEEAPDRLKEAFRTGVLDVLSGAGPQEAHERWLTRKVAAGISYGLAKTELHHPSVLGWGDLPSPQRLKNVAFDAIVRATYAAVCDIPLDV